MLRVSHVRREGDICLSAMALPRPLVVFRGRRRTTGCNFGVGNLVTLTALYLERRDSADGRSIAEILLSSDAAETITSVGDIQVPPNASTTHACPTSRTMIGRCRIRKPAAECLRNGSRLGGLVQFLYRFVEPCPPPKTALRETFFCKTTRMPPIPTFEDVIGMSGSLNSPVPLVECPQNLNLRSWPRLGSMAAHLHRHPARFVAQSSVLL
jgi:hypothetical protein